MRKRHEAERDVHTRAASDPTSIGNVLLALGVVTQEQIEEAVRYQREHPDVVLGETMARLGIISPKTLSVACARQELLRRKTLDSKNSYVQNILTNAASSARAVGGSLEALTLTAHSGKTK